MFAFKLSMLFICILFISCHLLDWIHCGVFVGRKCLDYLRAQCWILFWWGGGGGMLTPSFYLFSVTHCLRLNILFTLLGHDCWFLHLEASLMQTSSLTSYVRTPHPQHVLLDFNIVSCTCKVSLPHYRRRVAQEFFQLRKKILTLIFGNPVSITMSPWISGEKLKCTPWKSCLFCFDFVGIFIVS